MAIRQREDTVLEAKKSKVKAPPMFKVLLLNDDYTPMDFVVIRITSYNVCYTKLLRFYLFNLGRGDVARVDPAHPDAVAMHLDRITSYNVCYTKLLRPH